MAPGKQRTSKAYALSEIKWLANHELGGREVAAAYALAGPLGERSFCRGPAYLRRGARPRNRSAFRAGLPRGV